MLDHREEQLAQLLELHLGVLRGDLRILVRRDRLVELVELGLGLGAQLLGMGELLLHLRELLLRGLDLLGILLLCGLLLLGREAADLVGDQVPEASDARAVADDPIAGLLRPLRCRKLLALEGQQPDHALLLAIGELDRLLEICELLDRTRERDQGGTLLLDRRRQLLAAQRLACLIHRAAGLGHRGQGSAHPLEQLGLLRIGGLVRIGRVLGGSGEPGADLLEPIAQTALAVADHRWLEPAG